MRNADGGWEESKCDKTDEIEKDGVPRWRSCGTTKLGARKERERERERHKECPAETPSPTMRKMLSMRTWLALPTSLLRSHTFNPDLRP